MKHELNTRKRNIVRVSLIIWKCSSFQKYLSVHMEKLSLRYEIRAGGDMKIQKYLYGLDGRSHSQ